jgi:hypothetical protein
MNKNRKTIFLKIDKMLCGFEAQKIRNFDKNQGL